MSKPSTLLSLFAMAVCCSLLLGQSDRVAVFVSAPLRGGYVDTSKEIQDSVKDLKKKLRGMNNVFRVVDYREDADIVVTVVARGVGSQAYGQRLVYTTYYYNAVLTSVPIVANTFWVSAVMDVGQYRKELAGAYTQEFAQSLGAWTACAGQIANDLKAWVKANSAQLSRRNGVPRYWNPESSPPAATAPRPPTSYVGGSTAREKDWWGSTSRPATESTPDETTRSVETVTLPPVNESATAPAPTSGPTFRSTRWGMIPSQVLGLEGGDTLETTDDYVSYRRSIMGRSVIVGYFFDNRRLVRARYLLDEDYPEKSEYITDYSAFKQSLNEKYGDPAVDSQEWKDEQFKQENWGEAIASGHLTLLSSWETPNTKILMNLLGDGQETTLIVEYREVRAESNVF